MTRARCLDKLEHKAQLASASVRSFSTTLNSSPVTLAALARECDLTAKVLGRTSAVPREVDGVSDLVWPVADVLSKIQQEIARLPPPGADDQLVIIWNEAELKRALDSLKAVRSSLDEILDQFCSSNKASGGITIRKMPSATLPRNELAESLGLEDEEPRPATSASSHAYSYMTRRNRQLSQLLHLAIDKDNEAAVLELLQQGADPSMLRPGSLLSPLHRALDRGNEYIATLMAAGVDDVDEADPESNGRTPLMKGAMHGFTDKFIAVMCELGASPDPVDNDGNSALHYAADADRADDTIGVLVLGGADANARNQQGHTPLTTAVSGGHRHAAARLLEFGADIEARLPDGRSVLHHSILRKDAELCELLVEWGADLDEDLGDHTPLTLAIATDCTAIAESLIQAGADVDQRSTSGNTPLLTAISSDHPSLASRLIDRHASLTAANAVGYQPIHMAARRNSVAVLRRLVASGSAVDPTTNDAETPLCIAVKFRNQECVDLLIDVGADVNHRLGPADTVLSLALDAAARPAIQTLVNSGADAAALLVREDSDGGGGESTPLHVVASRGDTETLALLLDAAGPAALEARVWPGYTPLFAAARAGHLPTLKLLLARGADVHARSVAGESVLFVATAHLPVLKHLLSLEGVNVNHRDHYGATALHHAGIHGRLAAAKVLMGRGARSMHANVVYDSLEDFGVGRRYRQGTPAGMARQRGFERVGDVIDGWKYK